MHLEKAKASAQQQQREEMADRGDIQNENTLAEILRLGTYMRRGHVCVCVWVTDMARGNPRIHNNAQTYFALQPGEWSFSIFML